MSSNPTVGGDAQLSDPRYQSALRLHDCVALGEPLWYGNADASDIAFDWKGDVDTGLWWVATSGSVLSAHNQACCERELAEHIRVLKVELCELLLLPVEVAIHARLIKVDTELERLHALRAWVAAHNFDPHN